MKVTISLEEKFHKKTKEYAKTHGQTFSGLIKISVERYLENIRGGKYGEK